MTRWIDTGPLDGILPNGVRVVDMTNGPVAIFRMTNDQLFAIADHCPHRDSPLSAGSVMGHQVTCPLHFWIIDLRTGRALPPDRGSVACYAVKTVDGRVLLQDESADDDRTPNG